MKIFSNAVLYFDDRKIIYNYVFKDFNSFLLS